MSDDAPDPKRTEAEAPKEPADATLPDPVEEVDETHDELEGDDEYEDDDDEDGDDEEDDEDDDEDEPAAAEGTPSKGVSLGQLLGVGALCLALGAMIAGGVVGVMAAADAPRAAPRVVRAAVTPSTSALTAALAAPPRVEARPVAVAADASAVAALDASADGAAVVQETDPEDLGDGVMDDLDDGPPPRVASRSNVRRAVVTPPTVGAVPTRGRPSRVVTSDEVPEGSAQGYVDGRPVRIEVTRLDGKPVERHTAQAYRRMYAAAEHDHVHLHIVSGFRTMEHQQALYRAYQRGQGNLAAVPGHSNHQSGHALDLNTRAPGVLRWLERNGRRFGFRRTVPTEPWHWEWW